MEPLIQFHDAAWLINWVELIGDIDTKYNINPWTIESPFVGNPFCSLEYFEYDYGSRFEDNLNGSINYIKTRTTTVKAYGNIEYYFVDNWCFNLHFWEETPEQISLNVRPEYKVSNGNYEEFNAEPYKKLYNI